MEKKEKIVSDLAGVWLKEAEGRLGKQINWPKLAELTADYILNKYKEKDD